MFDEKNTTQNNSVKSYEHIACGTLLLKQNGILAKMWV